MPPISHATASETALTTTASHDVIADSSTKRAIRVLVVDDSAVVRRTLERFLVGKGHQVCTAETGNRALEILREQRFVLMLCDIEMPGISGLETVPHALEIDPDLAVIMLTAVDSASAANTALGAGALDYLIKPVKTAALSEAMDRALHRRMLLIERRRTEQIIREEVALRTDELEHKTHELELRTRELEKERARLRDMTVAVPEMLIYAMEAKDIYLRGHSQRVAALAAAIAQELGLDDDEIERIRLAGRLHDVGKIGIQESVLNKPGRLTPAEFEHIKDHVRLGVEILKPMTHLGPVLEYVQDHHERYNGRGYPRGRQGEAISVGALILGAADSFDALTSQRAYREPLSPEQALAILQKESPEQLFGPRIFEALQAVVAHKAVLPFIVETS